MERDQRFNETHVMVFPLYPQGHINPMLQFAKRLASKGLKVTFVIPAGSISKSMHAQVGSINIEIICEGFGPGRKEGISLEDHLNLFRIVASQGLSELIEKQSRSKHPVKILVYDSALPWVQDIAEQFGVDGAPFFTQSCAVSAIYLHFIQGEFNIPSEGSVVSLPFMPILSVNDLPSFLNAKSSSSALLNLVLMQFSNFQKVKWILFNTFDKLEDEVMKYWMASQGRIKTIGPTIPSMFLDKRMEEDKDYGLTLFKQDIDTCITWLDRKEIGSVVYVSFGSLASLGEEQMEELAWGLKRSNSHFLWVVREWEKKKLPNNFVEETSDKGLVVSWCPQLEVLAHEDVGCFMTHCGWNSTLEALSLGVPMVAMPQSSDQATNAKFIEDVWKVGIRVKGDEKGIVKRGQLEKCISEIMEGERGKEMKKNAERWKELAKEAANEGGSSDNNIEEFVAEILCS